MDIMEASCIFYVKVGTFTHLERSTISLLTVNKSGIVTLTVQHDMIVRLTFTLYLGDHLRQTSADVLSLEQNPTEIERLGVSSSHAPQIFLVTRRTTSDRPFAHCGAVRNPCNLQPYSVGFILSVTIMLDATYSILT